MTVHPAVQALLNCPLWPQAEEEAPDGLSDEDEDSEAQQEYEAAGLCAAADSAADVEKDGDGSELEEEELEPAPPVSPRCIFVSLCLLIVSTAK